MAAMAVSISCHAAGDNSALDSADWPAGLSRARTAAAP
jgi:hypothetical protein